MANNLTNAEENRLLAVSVDGVEVCLFTADPTETGSLSAEVSAVDYERQAVTFNAPSGGSTTPTADVEFAVAGEDWGTITHAGLIADAGEPDAGTLRWYGPVSEPKVIDTGDQAVIPAADLTVTLS